MEDNVETDMKTEVKTKKILLKAKLLILLVLCTIILLITEIYAWISSQKDVSINSMQGRIEVAEGLLISLDADNWSEAISFGTPNKIYEDDIMSELSSVDSDWSAYDEGIGTVNITINEEEKIIKSCNIRPKVEHNDDDLEALDSTGYLVPMSTTGIFENKLMKLFYGSFQGNKLSKIKQINTDEDDAENVDDLCKEGYYAFDIYLMNNSTQSENNEQLQLNFDSIVQEIMNHGGTDYGLKNCVRVALALYDETSDVNDKKEEIIKNTYDSDIKQIAIWEPNADKHSEYVQSQNENVNKIVSALADDENAKTYAIKKIPVTPESAVANTILDVYSTTDTANLEEQVTLQTSGDDTIEEIDGVNTVLNATGVVNITDIDGNPFMIEPNKICKMRIYMWLEGQDVDCVNWASHSEGMNVNIGLAKGKSLGRVGDLAWKQMKDDSEGTSYVTNGEITLEVGTTISGYSSGGENDWCILGAENGRLLITTKDANEKIKYDLADESKAQAASIDLADVMYEYMVKYKDDELADKVRAISINDINRITNYDPYHGERNYRVVGKEEYTNIDGEKEYYDIYDYVYESYGAEDYKEYNHKVTYTKKEDGYIYYKGEKNYTEEVKSKTQDFKYYNGSEWKTLNVGESVTLTSNGYCYYITNLLSWSWGDEYGFIGLSTESLAYQTLFDNESFVIPSNAVSCCNDEEDDDEEEDEEEYFGLTEYGVYYYNYGDECENWLSFVRIYGSNSYHWNFEIEVATRPTVILKSDLNFSTQEISGETVLKVEK